MCLASEYCCGALPRFLHFTALRDLPQPMLDHVEAVAQLLLRDWSAEGF